MKIKDDEYVSPFDYLEDFPLGKDPSKVVKIGSQLPDSLKKQFLNL